MRKRKLAAAKNVTVVNSHPAMDTNAHGPMRFQDSWFLEKLAQFDRETCASSQLHRIGSATNAPDN